MHARVGRRRENNRIVQPQGKGGAEVKVWCTRKDYDYDYYYDDDDEWDERNVNSKSCRMISFLYNSWEKVSRPSRPSAST